ncbi:hypothetical protein ScPMuIL_001889 [Solemya velum]
MNNGIGRYVCQLQRITLSFCKSHADSRGMRDFIENHLLDFTKANPGVVVYLKPRRHRKPRIMAQYLNGYTESVPLPNHRADEICKWVDLMKTRSGVKVVRLRKMWHTDNPSIQGLWHPFLNKDTSLNIKTFPDKEHYKFEQNEKSATDSLLEKMKTVKLSSEID